MAAPGNMRSAIVTAAVMIAGSLAWIAGISLSGLKDSRGFFGAGPLIADANLILEVFLVAGITYGFLLARRGDIEAHQINQTTWVVLNIGLIALVMAGSMQDGENAKGRGLRQLAHRRDLAARGVRNAHRARGSVDRAADEQRAAAQPARGRVEKPDARGFRRLLGDRAARLSHLLLLVHRMRRFAAIVLASLAALWPALPTAQHGAKPEINSPFLVNPDVARWRKGFENEDREVYRKRNEILSATGVKPGMAVADVGARSALFTMLFAQAVKPGGRVYAVDISRAFIQHIGERARAEGMDNVTTILTKGTQTQLPEASLDLLYTCDTYHHFEHPGETLQSIRRALKPGGRMVVIDFEKIPGQTHQQRIDHTRADKQTAIREIEAAGFRFVEEKKLMSENYFAVFQRP